MVSSASLPRRGHASRANCLAVIAAAAALAGISSHFAISFARVVQVRSPWRSNYGNPSRVTARAGPAEGEVEALPSLSEASVYMTEVDMISGELDVSGIPNEMGVYAIHDSEGKLQYIGLSRQISKSVAAHAESIGVQDAGSAIAAVHCTEMPGESKEVLKATWERWIREHMEGGGEIPAGNLPENAPGCDPRWRTRAGNTRPPLNLAGTRGITTPAEAIEAVKGAVEKHPVVLFMKGTPVMPQCGFSARTVGIMREVGVPFETVDVMNEETNPGVRDAVKQFSNWPTIPQLFVNGQLVGGADIVGELYTTGELQQQLKTAASSGASGEERGSNAASKSNADSATETTGEILLINDPSRPVASGVSKLLDDNFKLHTLRIVDESSQHEGDAGALEMGLTSESHFRVEIVAPEFEGLTPVLRQQKVFEVLSGMMPKIHALSLVTKTPAELA